MALAYVTKASLTVAVLLAGPALSGCAPKPSIDDGRPPSDAITVAASDDFCQLSKRTAGTGASTFVVTNDGTVVTEFYVYGAGDRVMGAVENIAPGLQRKLVVQLPEPGNYYTSCKPGMIGDGIRGAFTVTGNAVPLDTAAMFQQAVGSYQNYVTAQTAELVTATEAFVGAIKKGDVEGAEALYPKTRTYYQRIAPIAALFPDDLDRRINLREADVRPGEKWTGFHRLEKDLWVTKLQPDTDTIADQLLADVKELDAAVRDPKWTTDAARVVGGSQHLLDELTTMAITGTEDVYSHTDLWDFQAGLVGARAAIGSFRPIISARDPELGRQLDQAFATAQGLLDSHHWNGGFVFYDTVTEPERRALSDAIAALSADVARVRDTITQR